MTNSGNGNGTPKSNNKIYNKIIRVADKFVPGPLRPLWIHPAGPKTVFFWGPLMKWGLVIAGLDDLRNRPAELISIQQSVSLAITGLIWSRYAVVIIPRNYSLLSVNMCVCLLQSYLCLKAIKYRMNNTSNYYTK